MPATDPEMLRRTAITVLREHELVDGQCRACRTAGACSRAVLAANTLDFLSDPPGWLVALSRQCCDDPAIVREVLAGLRGSLLDLAAAESNRSVFPRGAARVSPVPRTGPSSAAATRPQPWPIEGR